MTTSPSRDLRRYAWLSIAAAIATIALKSGAWLLTGSVGLLSDAAESVVNLVAAVVALVALSVAAQPADDDHHFGHSKAEYFSAAVEGLMIFVAAVVILVTSVQRFLHPQPLENLGVGLAVSVVAVLVGINIVITGVGLLKESVGGLMDAALPQERHREIAAVLQRFASTDVDFHALRTRKAGHQEFADLHLLVPGHWTVRRGHDLAEAVEEALHQESPALQVIIHLEPLEDPRSYDGMPVDVPVPVDGLGREPLV